MTNTILHLPKAVTQHLPLVDDLAAVRAVADLVSKYRYGCPSALLLVEHREVLLGYIEELWHELDLMSEGMAS